MKYLGVDLGGTNMVAGVLDDQFLLISEVACKTKIPRPEKDVCDDMVKISQKALRNVNLTFDDIAWIGVGCPGTVNIETGIVEYSANLFFHNWPLTQMLESRTAKKVFLGNDANVAAYAEFVAGAAKGTKNSITITLGTGVGTGIIIDGKIYGGCNFAGAEAGHTVIVKDGLSCFCGRKGCLEAYASARGLVHITQEALKRDKQTKSCLWDMISSNNGRISGRMPFAAMKKKDEIGELIIREYVSYLACGVVNIINIFQPEVLCIGGGISREGEALLNPLRTCVEKERYSKHSKIQTKILQARFTNNAGIIGAALLGM